MEVWYSSCRAKLPIAKPLPSAYSGILERMIPCFTTSSGVSPVRVDALDGVVDSGLPRARCGGTPNGQGVSVISEISASN
jgi:hypothetical protein